ncbi:site-specific integrase [Vibrio anguillarum]|uniref:site-specific integrase n=1 Tax=Vibrio anguillarum TaxID=55601 RepID=UPI00188B356A|nr:site-specific integrase [Vibrio anguillarum]MBF4385269.1 site-specific integrase [Vibrio anguillarum]MBF4392139.1 site-specific integrase [Vibrio anguillarum]MBF4431228.1 site-specific integrase [Vibrio anguillarum]
MYQSLTKGLAIYRQEHTKSIYVRLRIDGKELKRSLKTNDVEEAKSKAWALKFELEGMQKAGLTIEVNKVMTVRSACLSVISELEHKKPFKPIYKDYIYIYKTYIIPFFNKKSFEELTTKNIRIYFYDLGELSATRKNLNKTCFKKLFLFLEEEEILKKKNFPSLPENIETKQTAIGIDIPKHDLETIRKFINSDSFINQEKINFKTKEYRQIFPYVFEFLLETGIRTGQELNNIRVKDLFSFEDHIFVKISKGKTAYKNRDVLLSNNAASAIIEALKITTRKEITQDNLFSLKDRFIFETSFNKICDFCKLFDQIIKRLIEENKINSKYTLYSLRHTYITLQLLSGTDMYLVSKQVGNSLEMIQKHYDHSMIKDSKNIMKLLGYTELDLLSKEYADIEENRRSSLTDEELALEELNNMLMFENEYTEEEIMDAFKKAGREYK